MDPQSIVIAISIAVLVFYITGLSPGGIIVPLYLAYFFSRPQIILGLLLVALATHGLVSVAERFWIIYGRQRFALAILVSVFLQWAIISWLPESLPLSFGALGLVIPGVFAAELHRQGIFITTLLLLLTAGLIHLVLGIFGGGAFLW